MSSLKRLLLLLSYLAPLLLIAIGCSREFAELPSTPLVEAIQLQSNSEFEQALIRCDEAIAAEPENPVAMTVRGRICEALDDTDAARLAYERALRLRPDDREAAFRLNQLDARKDERKRIRFVTSRSRRSESDAPRLAGSTTEEAGGPDGQLHSHKSYPGVYSEQGLDSQTVNRPNKPQLTPKPTTTALERAIMEGQRQDANAREAARMAAELLQRESRDEQYTSTEPEFNVTRFDLGLGVAVPTSVNAPISTTGRRSVYIEEENVERQRMLVGQAIAQPMCDGLRPRFFDAPRRDFSPQPVEIDPQETTCSDGRDNDGNGLFDRSDPNCWLDDNPASYNKNLDEFIPVLPSAGGTLNATSIAPPPT